MAKAQSDKPKGKANKSTKNKIKKAPLYTYILDILVKEPSGEKHFQYKKTLNIAPNKPIGENIFIDGLSVNVENIIGNEIYCSDYLVGTFTDIDKVMLQKGWDRV